MDPGGAMQEALVREIKALQQYKASYEDLSRKFELIEHELQLRDQRHTQRLQQLQEKHDALEASNAALREESERVKKEVSQRGQRNHRVYRKLQQAAQLLEAREKEFEQNRAQQDKRCVDLQSQVALLHAQLEAKEERIAALLRDNAELRLHVEAETVPVKQFHDLQNAHAEALYEHKVLEESLQALERELAVLRTSKSEVQQQFGKAEKRVAELQAEVLASNRKLGQYVQKLQELQPELEENRSHMETARAKIGLLEKEKSTLQHHLASTRVNLKALQDQRNELQQALAAVQAREAMLKQQVQELNQQLETAKSQSQELHSQQQDLQGTGAALQEKFRALQRQHGALQQRYNKLEQSFQKQAITIDEINTENEQLTSKVCQLTKALSQKSKELQALAKGQEAERKRSDALEQANSSLVQEKLILENSMYRHYLNSTGNGTSANIEAGNPATAQQNRFSMQTPGLLRTQTSPITANTTTRHQLHTHLHHHLDESEAADVLFSSHTNIPTTIANNGNKDGPLFTPPPARQKSLDRLSSSGQRPDDLSTFEEEISRLEGSLQTHLQDMTRHFG